MGRKGHIWTDEDTEKVCKGMRHNWGGKMINECFFGGDNTPPDTRQINSKIGNLKQKNGFKDYKARPYADTKSESADDVDTPSNGGRKRALETQGGKAQKKSKTLFQTPNAKDVDGDKTQTDVYLEGATDTIVPRRLGPYVAHGKYWVADLIRRARGSSVRMIKLPESNTERNCVILEVIHKPLEAEHLKDIVYLEDDSDKYDSLEGKMPIRSHEQLRKVMDRSVADHKKQGGSFCMKYIFYAPAGYLWTKGAIKVISGSHFCGILWQVREELGVDEIEITELMSDGE
eukprot:518578-Amorphochlora_amoeboformis.AAC.1